MSWDISMDLNTIRRKHIHRMAFNNKGIVFEIKEEDSAAGKKSNQKFRPKRYQEYEEKIQMRKA